MLPSRPTSTVAECWREDQVGKLTTCRLSRTLQRRFAAARCGISAPDIGLARTSRPTMPQDGVRAAGRPARSRAWHPFTTKLPSSAKRGTQHTPLRSWSTGQFAQLAYVTWRPLSLAHLAHNNLSSAVAIPSTRRTRLTIHNAARVRPMAREERYACEESRHFDRR